MSIKIDKKYLPSKNFLVALAVAALLILVTIAFNFIKPNGRNNVNSISSIDVTSSMSQVDSDHDGLPDWEEALYGTDPHNPDTDGDGTSDGDEIKAGRDPLKANTAPKGQAPNDYIDPKIVAQSNAVATADQNLNATDKMAHDLMSDIFASQPVTGTMDQDTADTLVQQSIQDIPQKNFAGTSTVTDLNLIPIPKDNQILTKDLNTYGNGYYSPTEVFEKIMGQDLAAVDASLSNNTPLNTTKIQNIIALYQSMVNYLISLPLPATANSSGVIYSLQIINDLQKLIQIDNDILHASTNADTASIYADLESYTDTLNDITGALDTMDAMLGIKR